MGGNFSSISSRCVDYIDGKKCEMICIICNNKIIDYHCCRCINCNSLTHINCQTGLKVKNRCKKCISPLKIYSQYGEDNT
jgi:hypothetical protein